MEYKLLLFIFICSLLLCKEQTELLKVLIFFCFFKRINSIDEENIGGGIDVLYSDDVAFF